MMSSSAGDEDLQRTESEAERLDRNFMELLQELRVAETGVQILFAFLLSIAFQPRFQQIDALQRGLYLTSLIASSLATAVLIAPAAVHRVIFRRRLRDELVDVTSRLAGCGLILLCVAILSAVGLIGDLVVGGAGALAIVSVLALVFLWTWFLVPIRLASRAPSARRDPSDRLLEVDHDGPVVGQR